MAGLTPAQVRRHFGAYTTPRQVVSAQVNLIEDVLRRHFRLPAGFGAPEVVIVDPAVGTGAYPLAIARRVSDSALADRLHLFEPRPEAAAAARRRLRRVLGRPVAVNVRDALAQPFALDAPLLVCLGNPPYNRQLVQPGLNTPRKGGWVRFGRPRPILADFRAPDAGVHLKSLYNDYVYFWRWAVWLVCEQRQGPGIVSLVTASSYLRGPGFGGMRDWLRAHFDDLWIIDLEGDGRGTRRSANVFDSVLTPVAIALGARYATPQPTERVHFVLRRGSQYEKLGWLGQVRGLADVAWQDVCGPRSAPLVAHTITDFHRWPRLSDLFPTQYSGCQMKRRWPIAPSVETLRQRWARLLQLPPDQRARQFQPTRDRDISSKPHGLPALQELDQDTPCPAPARYAYRSFDRQWVLADARLGDFLRPTLWRIAGPRQLFLTSLLTHPLGPGPAVVATRLVPDLDHFRGSFGGRAVLPLWRDAAATEANLCPGVLERLGAAYGTSVTPEGFAAYCYALLSTPTYQARFEDELRMPGARVPLTASRELFERTASLGEQLIGWHTFDHVPGGAARVVSPVEGPAGFAYHADALRVGCGAIAPVPSEVWEFAISGLHVIRSWLRHRVGVEPWSDTLTSELLELVWVLEATMALQPDLTAALDEVVGGRVLLL